MTSCTALFLAALLGGGEPASAPRRLSVAQALDLVATRLPHIRAARSRMEASAAGAHSARGRLLPSVHLSDTQSWTFSGLNISPKLVPPDSLKSLAGFPTDVTYNLLTAAARQPLLGLGHLSQDYAASDRQADAGAADLRAVQADAQAMVKTGFLRLFEAQALAATAEASRQDLEEQVSVTQKKVDAGTMTTADVLRLKVAAATAKQQIIAAGGQAAAARANLLEMLGMAGEPPGAVEFVEPSELQEITAPPDFRQARQDALRQRPELESRRLQAQASSHRASAKSWALWPEINFDVSYTHAWLEPIRTKGPTGPLTVQALGLGLSASWGVWEWGATWYDHERADAEAEAASADAEALQEQIGAEVATRHADMEAAVNAVEVAQTQVASAEEAYRVMQALSNAGSATTTDLLDAQSALTEAKMSLVRARYEAAIAAVALQRATGRD